MQKENCYNVALNRVSLSLAHKMKLEKAKKIQISNCKMRLAFLKNVFNKKAFLKNRTEREVIDEIKKENNILQVIKSIF